MLFEKEKDMLDAFLQLVEDADILSGWNSEGYDIPYTVGRIQKVLSSDDTGGCVSGVRSPGRGYSRSTAGSS
jgi:DNA polymerase elongation subunit (family B)